MKTKILLVRYDGDTENFEDILDTWEQMIEYVENQGWVWNEKFQRTEKKDGEWLFARKVRYIPLQK